MWIISSLQHPFNFALYREIAEMRDGYRKRVDDSGESVFAGSKLSSKRLSSFGKIEMIARLNTSRLDTSHSQHLNSEEPLGRCVWCPIVTWSIGILPKIVVRLSRVHGRTTVEWIEMICRENRKPLCKNRSKNNIESYRKRYNRRRLPRRFPLERLWTI